jgi:membrane protease YdiL (CAAX protease family)
MAMSRLALPVAIAALLWFVMFSPWTGGRLNFWCVMSVSAVILWTVSAWLGHDFRKQFRFKAKDIAVGAISAAMLWGIFYVGDALSSLLFDFAGTQVEHIYAMKDGKNSWLMGALLLLLIGPAEEIFWRGYVQRSLAEKYGEWMALTVTTLTYALVHVWSFNFMLVMAALVCGAFWGLLYRYCKNMTTLVVSHALWDVAAFILFPL